MSYRRRLRIPGFRKPQSFPQRRVILESAHPLARGLVGCYLLGIDARDYSFARNHGTYQNGCLPTITERGLGLDLGSGSQANVTVPVGPLSNASFTQIFWSKGNGTISGNDANGSRVPTVQIGSTLLSLVSQGTARLLDASGPFDITSLHQTAVSYDSPSGAIKIYRDGVLAGTGNATGGATSWAWDSSSTYAIGRGYGGEGFNGVIDHVKFYDHALTDQEVFAEFADPFSLFKPTARFRAKSAASNPASVITQLPGLSAPVSALSRDTASATSAFSFATLVTASAVNTASIVSSIGPLSASINALEVDLASVAVQFSPLQTTVSATDQNNANASVLFGALMSNASAISGDIANVITQLPALAVSVNALENDLASVVAPLSLIVAATASMTNAATVNNQFPSLMVAANALEVDTASVSVSFGPLMPSVVIGGALSVSCQFSLLTSIAASSNNSAIAVNLLGPLATAVSIGTNISMSAVCQLPALQVPVAALEQDQAFVSVQLPSLIVSAQTDTPASVDVQLPGLTPSVSAVQNIAGIASVQLGALATSINALEVDQAVVSVKFGLTINASALSVNNAQVTQLTHLNAIVQMINGSGIIVAPDTIDLLRVAYVPLDTRTCSVIVDPRTAR